MCDRKIDAELDSFANDFGFGKFDERRVNLEASAFYTGFGSEIGQVLERFDKFRSAIWVAAVVDRVYADKNVIGRNHFRPRSAYARKMVLRAGFTLLEFRARFRFRALLRHGDIVCERGAAEEAQVDFGDAMLFCA